MALSQIQCLDENNVNPRTHESKPEFFYCEDQRLALEALMRDGREGFGKYVEARGLRGFLSDPEQERLAGSVEPYDPGAELFSGESGDKQSRLSLHYWPELSDTSVPQMDLFWPDGDGYRGVTRATVYAQPPLEGQVHIKEVVRKMIAQAQKHLRVRCTGGAEFITRSCTKVRGRMGHRFMFVDGDKAVSGSYNFTWMSSRLDRNLITVVTGQAVDAFDRLFRFLYVNSSSVDLAQVAKDPEPVPDPSPQPTVVAAPSAAVARKLYNPKYALVAATNPSPTTSVGIKTPKEPENPENTKKKGKKRAHEEPTQEVPPLHPGLVDLEKACLIAYLPTWPEPDPPSDVIGFINIRDANKPTQVHLQRSEMFETSQAIRFSSPLIKAEEPLPEVAKPKQTTITHEQMNKPQPAGNNNAENVKVNKAKPAPPSTASSDQKSKEEAPEQKSPTLEQNLPTFNQKSSISEQKSPTLEEKSPTVVGKLPTSQQKLPTSEEKSLTSGQKPTSGQKSPALERKLPTLVDKSSTFNQKSTTSVEKSVSLEHKSPTSAQKLSISEQKLPTLGPKLSVSEQILPASEQKSPTLDRKSSTSEQKSSTLEGKLPTSEQKSLTSGQKSPTVEQKLYAKQNPELDKDITEAVKTNNTESSSPDNNQDSRHDTPFLTAHTLLQSSSQLLTPNEGEVQYTTKTVSTNSPKSDSVPKSNTEQKAELLPSLNSQSDVVYRAHTQGSDSAGASQMLDLTELNTQQNTQEKPLLSHADSLTQAVHIQQQISPERSANIQTQTVQSSISTPSSSSVESENNHVAITTVQATTTTPVPSNCSSSSCSPLTSTSTALNLPIPLSPSLTKTPPIPKPRTVKLVMKDGNPSNIQKLPEVCLVRTTTRTLGIINEPEVAVGTPAVKESETVTEVQDHRICRTKAQKDSEKKENLIETSRPIKNVASQETKDVTADVGNNGKAETQSVTGTEQQTQSDVLVNDAPKAVNVDIQEMIPTDVEPKTSVPTDYTVTPETEMEIGMTEQTDAIAPEKTLADHKIPKVSKENEAQLKTYHTKLHEPQRISYYRLTPVEIDVLEPLDSMKSPRQCTSYSQHISQNVDGTQDSTADANDQHARITASNSIDSTAKVNTHGDAKEHVPQVLPSTHSSEKAFRLHLSDTPIPDIHLQTQENKLLSLRAYSPTPDRAPSLTASPDSQMTSPDARPCTPDFRTPTSDVYDGYISPREDSTVSTASEEYYECSDSPCHEPTVEAMFHHSHGSTEDHTGLTGSNSPNAATTCSSPVCINDSPDASTLVSSNRNSSSSETQTLGPVRASSTLLESKVNMREMEGIANEAILREDKVSEMVAEQRPRGVERTDVKEANREAYHFKQETATEMNEKSSEAPVFTRRVLSHSAAALVDGVTTGHCAVKGTKLKRFPSSDLKQEAVFSGGERPENALSGREKAVKQRALIPRGGERRENPQFVQIRPKPFKDHLLDSGGPTSSRPLRSPPTQFFGTQLWGSHQMNQRERSKVSHGTVNPTDSAESHPSAPPRPPSPEVPDPVAGQKPMSESQQSLLSHQPPTVQGAAIAGHMQTPHQKPPTSSPHTNLQPHLSPYLWNHEEGRLPFNLSFSKLYNLKVLRSKMNKSSTQSKKSSTSPPGEGHKSTS
ncbi:uncharacterized protein KZ484_003769 isoform 2-T2 [Pholidichthys leucotaenia]